MGQIRACCSGSVVHMALSLPPPLPDSYSRTRELALLSLRTLMWVSFLSQSCLQGVSTCVSMWSAEGLPPHPPFLACEAACCHLAR